MTRQSILIVSGDCPSHPYACVKLATVLAQHHNVSVAGPSSMMPRIISETRKYNETAAKQKIECISIGDFATEKFCNVRPVVNPQEYSSIQIILRTLLDRDYKPFALADCLEDMMENQVGTYETIKKLLPKYDLVYAVHSVAPTVFDARGPWQRRKCDISAKVYIVLFTPLRIKFHI
jgi:hypothetical protein